MKKLTACLLTLVLILSSCAGSDDRLTEKNIVKEFSKAFDGWSLEESEEEKGSKTIVFSSPDAPDSEWCILFLREKDGELSQLSVSGVSLEYTLVGAEIILNSLYGDSAAEVLPQTRKSIETGDSTVAYYRGDNFIVEYNSFSINLNTFEEYKESNRKDAQLAIEIVDKYLDFEMDSEEAYDQIMRIADRMDTNETYDHILTSSVQMLTGKLTRQEDKEIIELRNEIANMINAEVR